MDWGAIGVGMMLMTVKTQLVALLRSAEATRYDATYTNMTRT